ncbi:MAG: U32 family peptidase [Lachnospiraceae bacterium]|nr:U32 family peptidase [Lachnospiraceae bacterium]
MGKVELLSPAGSFDALKGALKAGADAVYLGGTLYSARAYADNFTQEEICAGIHLAHVFGRKVYLTVNTLVKERELDGLYHFLLPFYEEGLDGVIVQDMGALVFIREHFPGLSLHASTQMTITGKNGASLALAEGISRIVPARELSLEEIRSIKETLNVEIETFVHGAMCYCYSGQCLLSSLLGGRSGNRGRCAQPCRLPYEAKACKREGKDSGYLLSMKDMCTLNDIPELIEAGIDSFKIEGRMKKPAYAAGVTAVYRKYIDLYYEGKGNYQVDKKDMETLKSLYIRSGISDGYYFRHNGKEMISISSPAYSGADENLLAAIEQKFIASGMRHKVRAQIQLKEGEAARMTLVSGLVSVTETGDLVQKALKQPLTEEKIREQAGRSGNSLLEMEQIEVEMDGSVFMPVKALNELRRRAGAAMETELVRRNGLFYGERRALPPERESGIYDKKTDRKEMGHCFHVSVQTKEQLQAALDAANAPESRIGRIYLSCSLLSENMLEELKKYQTAPLFPGRLDGQGNTAYNKADIYISTPYIVREKNIFYLEEIYKAFSSGIFAGVLVRNLESLWFFQQKKMQKDIILDANLYVWNREAVSFFRRYAEEFYLPLEYNFHEWKEICKAASRADFPASMVVYGRQPVMVSANCLKKTTDRCNKIPEMVMLKDRYGKQFPVNTDCSCCYNVIYNSVPLSLHKLFSGTASSDRTGSCASADFGSMPPGSVFSGLLPGFGGFFRLDFTVEDKGQTLKVLNYFREISEKYREPFYKEYTTGHYKRGVE